MDETSHTKALKKEIHWIKIQIPDEILEKSVDKKWEWNQNFSKKLKSYGLRVEYCSWQLVNKTCVYVVYGNLSALHASNVECTSFEAAPVTIDLCIE